MIVWWFFMQGPLLHAAAAVTGLSLEPESVGRQWPMHEMIDQLSRGWLGD